MRCSNRFRNVQIPRSARDDNRRGIFSTLLKAQFALREKGDEFAVGFEKIESRKGLARGTEDLLEGAILDSGGADFRGKKNQLEFEFRFRVAVARAVDFSADLRRDAELFC